MASFLIRGGRRLEGEHSLQGAKNSALPILAAAAATGGVCRIRRCPALTDVDATLNILRCLGCGVVRQGDTVTVDASGLSRAQIPDELMQEMRSSIIFLGPLLAALGCAELSAPGGCEIGKRPIDFHLDAMRALGVEIRQEGGRLFFRAERGLRGARIALPFPSVGATENLMIAAARAKGATTLANAAREPEILDLAAFLAACGAKILGAGSSTLVIEGVQKLHGAEHTVIPDRIAAATYLSAAAITGGALLLREARPGHMRAFLAALERAGCSLQSPPDALYLKAPARLRHFPPLITRPYPGFPTDAQANILALASAAEGTSRITETIFENRFRHADELRRMGARILVLEGGSGKREAVIEGVPGLHGARVDACDLRAGASLVVAGLCAEGETRVCDIRHIDRGCERLEEGLRALGADIIREDQNCEP